MLRFPLHAYATCAVLLIGCQSAVAPLPPAPPAPPDVPLSFQISGPSQIDTNGPFSWEAFAFGGSGFYEYQWLVTNRVGTLITSAINRKLSLLVDDTDGDLLLTMRVTSGGKTRVDTFAVRNCIGGCDDKFVP
jgi:hypothetical protein